MHFIKQAKHIKDYELEITFEDGVRKKVNLQPYLEGEIFQPLKNLDYFKKVKVSPDIDTIYWDNGADLSPEFLYQIGVG